MSGTGQLVPDIIQGEWPTVDNPALKVMVYHQLLPLQEAKICPSHDWKYPFATIGMGTTPSNPSYVQRFRIFAQARSQSHDDIAQWTARMFVRLWSNNFNRFDIDHAVQYRRLVDVYLAFGGEPGGEHKFEVDGQDVDNDNRPQPASSIYIYQAWQIENPIQLAREIAHEYGHASIPPVGPFDGPEDWANGDAGERIYMRWLSKDLKAGKITMADVVNADPALVEKQVQEKFFPLATKIGINSPNPALTKGKSEQAYWEYVGTACHASEILPPRRLMRAMMLGGQNAATFYKELSTIAEETAEFTFPVPDYMKGEPFYIPGKFNSAQVKGATVLTSKNGWTKLKPTAKSVTVKGTPPKD